MQAAVLNILLLIYLYVSVVAVVVRRRVRAKSCLREQIRLALARRRWYSCAQ